MNKKNLVKGVMISIITLVVGFMAVAIPFNIFKSISPEGTRIFFLVEMVVYGIIGATFLIYEDRKEKRKAKEKARHTKRQAQIKDVKENWYNLAA